MFGGFSLSLPSQRLCVNSQEAFVNGRGAKLGAEFLARNSFAMKITKKYNQMK